MDRRSDPARRLPDSYGFFHELNSQFRDMDTLGHINNVVLAAYYEDARVHFFVRLWGSNRRNDTDPYVMVANSTIDFLGEAPHPRTYRIGVGISKIGTTSVVVSEALFVDGTCIGLADVTIVNMIGTRPAPISEERRAKLAGSMLPFSSVPGGAARP
jgi:acyl-CoA thioester hydrolase